MAEPGGTGRLRFGLLGPLEVAGDEGALAVGGPRQRALLALLLLHGNTVLSRSRLIDALWGERPPETAANALQVGVHGLRKALGAGRIVTHAAGYALHLDPDELDVARFEHLVERARTEQPAAAVASLGEALDLWRGDALADLGDPPFAPVEAARLEEERLAAVERRFELEHLLGRDAELVAELERLVATHPLRERLACSLVKALYRSGRQADALDAQREARARLDELGIEPGPELRRLEQEILTHDSSLAAPAPRPALGNLPASPTPLVGRHLELGAVTALLERSDVRLLTLTGPGGTGKTRLALEAAWRSREAFPDGAVFVDLSPLADHELVAPTIVTALGAHEAGALAVDAAAAALRGRILMLVLDNFEQVDAAGPVVSALLAAAPGLTVLATSRSRLDLSGEHVYPVPPLRVPAAGERHVEELARTESVALFVARAAAASHGFELTSANAHAVAAICAALDGLPLAVELAAAQVRFLSLDELVTRLGRKLEVLTGGPRDMPARQRTLRATIDWSYELLDQPDRELVAALGVFAGGCTGSAAAAVCDATAHALQELVDRSLLQKDERPSGEPRYRMLETVREYALDELAAAGGEADARSRHAAYFRTMAVEAGAALWSPIQGPERAAWLERLEAEQDNMRAALQWADGAGDDTQLTIAVGLSDYWHVRGSFVEGRDQLARALSQHRGSEALRARALHHSSFFLLGLGDLVRADAVGSESLALYRRVGDPEGIGRSIHLLGHVAEARGENARALELARESLALALELDHTRGIIVSLSQVGHLTAASDPEGGRRLLSEAQELAREHGDDTVLADLCLVASRLERSRGDRAAALEQAIESLQVCLVYHMESGLGAALHELGLLAADVAPIEAARLLGAAERVRDAIGGSATHGIGADELSASDTIVATLSAELGDTAFETARAEGRVLSPEEAVTAAFGDDALRARGSERVSPPGQ